MSIYNSKTGKVRQVDIRPSKDWNGSGLLGVSIRFCSFEGANQHVWHVLQVEPNSPAEKAGLQSNVDYVIGAESILQDSEDLFCLIEAYDGKPLKLFVYNLLTDNCREVVITPKSDWGGEGLLGCGIGFGYLHRIPFQQKSEERVSDISGSQQACLPIQQSAQNLGQQLTGGDTIPAVQMYSSPSTLPNTLQSFDSSKLQSTQADPICLSSSNTASVKPVQSSSATSTYSITTPISIPGMPPLSISSPLLDDLKYTGPGEAKNLTIPPPPPPNSLL